MVGSWVGLENTMEEVGRSVDKSCVDLWWVLLALVRLDVGWVGYWGVGWVEAGLGIPIVGVGLGGLGC